MICLANILIQEVGDSDMFSSVLLFSLYSKWFITYTFADFWYMYFNFGGTRYESSSVCAVNPHFWFFNDPFLISELESCVQGLKITRSLCLLSVLITVHVSASGQFCLLFSCFDPWQHIILTYLVKCDIVPPILHLLTAALHSYFVTKACMSDPATCWTICKVFRLQIWMHSNYNGTVFHWAGLQTATVALKMNVKKPVELKSWSSYITMIMTFQGQSI